MKKPVSEIKQKSYRFFLRAIPIVAAITFLSGFMFFSTIPIRWVGLNPVILLQINPDFPGINLTEKEATIVAIKSVALDWFRKGGARFAFAFEKITEIKRPVSITEVSCQNAIPNRHDGRLNLYAVVIQDPDCTGQNCTFLWECGNEIREASVQFNGYDYSYALNDFDDGKQYIKSGLFHALGHVSGLNHCGIGDTVEVCENKQIDSQADPDTNSVLYKGNNSNTELSVDDQSGLITLYGAINLPFPESGKYALNEGDFYGIISVIHSENRLGLTTTETRARAGYTLGSLVDYSTEQTGKNPIQQTEDFYTQARAGIGDSTGEQLEIGRRILAGGIYLLDRLLADAENGVNDMDTSFLQLNLERQLELRRLIIDAQE